jgi:hypothetical protein
MDLQTTFVKTDDGFIRIDEDLQTTPNYFSFQTITEITFPTADKASPNSFKIRITRSMPAGLLEYFLGNHGFQVRVLRENSAHAVKHFHSR